PSFATCGGTLFGGVAQLVEQGNHNPCVGGSNPSAATNLIPGPRIRIRLRRVEPALRRALRRACALPPGSTLLVAVSGGADSTALLAGLASIAREFGLRLHAAHLHHRLRGAEADADLEAVRELCERLEVPLTSARWNTRARMARRGLTGED